MCKSDFIEAFGLRWDAAIFDLDGTLADSMHVWGGICRDWLAANGEAPSDSLEGDIARMTLTQSAKYVMERYAAARPSPGAIIAEWLDMAKSQYERSVAFKDGALDFLRALRGRGTALAIATSCFPEACEAFLRNRGARGLFSAIAYTDDAPGDKSCPDIWLLCAKKLGAQPHRCAVFEDMRAALGGARRAGMSAIAVFDRSNEAEWPLMRTEADYAIRSFLDISKAIWK
jgi:HAD superfamily hydrolase (TIGR01509 family)